MLEIDREPEPIALLVIGYAVKGIVYKERKRRDVKTMVKMVTNTGE